jgi:hypothetical protein
MTSGNQSTQAAIRDKAVLNITFMQKKSQETVSNTGVAVIRA